MLTDFGITKVFNNTSLLVAQFVTVSVNAASIAYAAPEVLYYFKRKDTRQPLAELPRGEIYAFGVIVNEMTCRKRPFC